MTDFKKLHEMTDEEIDFSDNPETDEEFWKDAEVDLNNNYRFRNLTILEKIKYLPRFRKMGFLGFLKFVGCVLKGDVKFFPMIYENKQYLQTKSSIYSSDQDYKITELWDKIRGI